METHTLATLPVGLEPEHDAMMRDWIVDKIEEGFTPVESILDSACEEVPIEECDLSNEELRSHAERLLEELSVKRWREERNWTNPTDNDRLDRAFAQMERQGIVARQDFTCCNTCGWSEIGDEIEKVRAAGVEVIGCVFYHSQDTDFARSSGSLYLAFSSVEEDHEQDRAVGNQIVQTLRSFGLEVLWEGDTFYRIQITGIVWKRRWRPTFNYYLWGMDQIDQQEADSGVSQDFTARWRESVKRIEGRLASLFG